MQPAHTLETERVILLANNVPRAVVPKPLVKKSREVTFGPATIRAILEALVNAKQSRTQLVMVGTLFVCLAIAQKVNRQKVECLDNRLWDDFHDDAHSAADEGFSNSHVPIVKQIVSKEVIIATFFVKRYSQERCRHRVGWCNADCPEPGRLQSTNFFKWHWEMPILFACQAAMANASACLLRFLGCWPAGIGSIESSSFGQPGRVALASQTCHPKASAFDFNALFQERSKLICLDLQQHVEALWAVVVKAYRSC